MGSNSKPFLIFLAARRADLRRIAGRSCGEHTVDDVCGEAWLVAADIGRKRGFAVDFSNHDDQEIILSWLYSKLIRYAEKNVRFAVKLDKDWDSEDADSAVNSLARLLTAPEQFDPLVRLQAEQEQFDPLELVKHSYSQASAYVILLDRFDWDLVILAEQLRLVVSTVRSRLMASGVHMKFQPSLFDRIQTIDPDFSPTVARGAVRTLPLDSSQQQLEWEFA